ncbi:MAG: TolC family outer membrane protein [Desulfobulbales bacterium]|nr:TolC family outer membrane protein [Desulfobulbales bacterium]
MKLLFRYFTIAAMGLMAWSTATSEAETLQDAVQHMLQNNPEIRSQAYNRLARDQEIIQARAGYLPIIDISYGAGIEDEDHPFDDTTHPQSTTLSLRQNVFRGFADQNEIKRQQARVDSAAYQLQGTSENIGLVTSRAYLNVLRQLEIQDLSKENLITHQRIYDQIKLRSESGIDRKADLDQVMARLALAESDVVLTEANVNDAKTDYQFVVGHIPENLVKPRPVDSFMPPTLEEAQQLALANYPILKSAQADLEARVAQHVVAKSNYFPKLDIAVDQNWEDDVDTPGYQEELRAIAVLSFNIFNGFSDKARIAETSHLISEAREIQNNTRRQIIESIRLSWVAYTSLQRRITYLENYVKSSGLTAEAFSKQWNIGRRTMFDVLDIEAELINAKIDLVNAQYDKIYAQYRLLSGIGKLIHTLGLEWPAESIVEKDEQQMQEEVPPEDKSA